MTNSELSVRAKSAVQPDSKRPIGRGRDVDGRIARQTATQGKKDRTRESTPKARGDARQVSTPVISATGAKSITGTGDGGSLGGRSPTSDLVSDAQDGWKEVGKKKRSDKRRESQNFVAHYEGPVLQPASRTRSIPSIKLERGCSNPLPFSYAHAASFPEIARTRTSVVTSPPWAVQRHPRVPAVTAASTAPIPIASLQLPNTPKVESSEDESDAPPSIFDEDDARSDVHSDTDLSSASIGELGLPHGIDPDERLLDPKSYFNGLEKLESEVVTNSGLFLMSRNNRQAYPNGSTLKLKFTYESFTAQGATVGLPSYDDKIMSYCNTENSGLRRTNVSTSDPAYWAFHILECRNLMLAVVSNIERLKRAQFCIDSINVLVLDPCRHHVAKLVGIEVSRIMSLHQSFEGALESILSRLTTNRIQESKIEELTQMLSRQSIDLLRHLGLPAGDSTVGQWRKAVLVLDLAIVSYSGAHIERFDQRFLSGEDLDFAKITSAWSYDTLCREGIILRRRSLRCLQKFLGVHRIWILQAQSRWEDDEDLYLSTSVEQFADIWGPTWEVKDAEDSDKVIKYNAGIGAIVPWQADKDTPLADGEAFCHWLSPGEAAGRSSGFLNSGARLLIGAPTVIEHKTSQLKDNEACKNKTQKVLQQLRSANLIEELGTRKASSYLAEEGVSACVGAYGMAVGATKVYKRRAGISHKESIFTAWKNSTGERHPGILEQWIGLEVSYCSRNARRRRLKSILNSTTMRNWLEACQTDCEALPCERAFREAIGSRDPRAFRDLYFKHQEWRKDLTRLVTCCLEGLLHSSIDEDGTLRALWIPQADKRVRVKLKQNQHSWTNFLADSEDSCFFAVMSGKCLHTDYKDASSCQQRPADSNKCGYTVLETALVVNDAAPKPKELKYRAGESEKSKQGRWSISKLPPGAKFPLSSGRLRVIEPFARTRLLVEWEIGVLKKLNDAKLHFSKSVGKETLHHWELKDHDDWPTKPIPLFILSSYEHKPLVMGT